MVGTLVYKERGFSTGFAVRKRKKEEGISLLRQRRKE